MADRSKVASHFDHINSRANRPPNTKKATKISLTMLSLEVFFKISYSEKNTKSL